MEFHLQESHQRDQKSLSATLAMEERDNVIRIGNAPVVSRG